MAASKETLIKKGVNRAIKACASRWGVSLTPRFSRPRTLYQEETPEDRARERQEERAQRMQEQILDLESSASQASELVPRMDQMKSLITMEEALA